MSLYAVISNSRRTRWLTTQSALTAICMKRHFLPHCSCFDDIMIKFLKGHFLIMTFSTEWIMLYSPQLHNVDEYLKLLDMQTCFRKNQWFWSEDKMSFFNCFVFNFYVCLNWLKTVHLICWQSYRKVTLRWSISIK